MKLHYTWKRIKNDGYGCQMLYAGEIYIGQYYKSMTRNDPTPYGFRFSRLDVYIPEKYTKENISALKANAENLTTEWFNKLTKGAKE